MSTVKIAARQRLSVGAVCRLERRRCRKRRSYWSRSVPGERRQGTTCFDVILEVSAERQHEERRNEEDREERRSGREVAKREREDRVREGRERGGGEGEREEKAREKEKERERERETRVRVSNVWRPERHWSRDSQAPRRFAAGEAPFLFVVPADAPSRFPPPRHPLFPAPTSHHASET